MAGAMASDLSEPVVDGFAATTPPGDRLTGADHDVADLQAKFPQLEILELLGRGGMGSVYKVRQRNLDRIVALKVIPPASARDPEFAERFAREARALARLNHPNIVTVYDFGQSGDVYYLLMEYVDGVNLRHTLRAGRLQPEEALAVVPQICDALQYAHDQGVVHRDIKPENVLLDRSGRIKIADFGLAKLLGLGAEDFSLTRTQQVMGTPRYMAPEQIDRPSKVDHRADIYSLGVVIYEMLTGELPVGRFALPSERSSVDPHIDRVVLRSLEREPEQRYQRASQLKSELATVSVTYEPSGNWSGPRFPTPAPVYVEPKPPRYDSDLAGPPLGYLLLLAAGMVIGCLMITAGFSMALLAFAWPSMELFGGFLGAAFGFICGGGGTLVGSYNSYRQLAGSEDLMRTPRTTWFDWLMRGYLLLGILVFAAAFIDFPDGNPSPVTFPELLIIGSIMILQGSLFALIRSLLPQRQSHSSTGGQKAELLPNLWRAAGIPAAGLAAIWLLVLLDVFYATPIIAHDEKGVQWLSFLFYQRWQIANWALGVGLIPICFGLLASCRALGSRTSVGGTTRVVYPFQHPAWMLAAAVIGLSTAVLPWAKLERSPSHEHLADRALLAAEADHAGRDFSGIDMAQIASLPHQFRYVTRDVVMERLGFVLLFTILLGVFALLPIPDRTRKLVTLGLGLAMLALVMIVLHEMADRPAKFILDQRTVLGITRFVERLGTGSPVEPSQWATPMSSVIAVQPAIGLYMLAASAILSIFLGLSGLSWNSDLAEDVQPTTERVPMQKSVVLPSAAPSPELQMRQGALTQVRGPAIGLCLTGCLGLLLTAVMLLLGLVVKPSRTVVTTSAAGTSQIVTALSVAHRDPQAIVDAIDRLASKRLFRPRLAQHMAQEGISASEAHASWLAIAMPVLLLSLLNVPISFLLVIGSIRMMRLESYSLAFGVSVLACLPCTPLWLISLPMGVWSLSVLARADVKAAFDQPIT